MSATVSASDARTKYVELPPVRGYDPDVWAATIASTVVTVSRLTDAYAEVDDR